MEEGKGVDRATTLHGTALAALEFVQQLGVYSMIVAVVSSACSVAGYVKYKHDDYETRISSLNEQHKNKEEALNERIKDFDQRLIGKEEIIKEQYQKIVDLKSDNESLGDLLEGGLSS